jgi:archaellum component FlaC
MNDHIKSVKKEIDDISSRMERLAKEVKYVDDMYSDELRTIIEHQNKLK